MLADSGPEASGNLGLRRVSMCRGFLAVSVRASTQAPKSKMLPRRTVSSESSEPGTKGQAPVII